MIRGSNAEQMVGRSESDNFESRIYAGSFLKSPRDVENLVVRVIDGTPIYVRDVANVSWAKEDARQLRQLFHRPGLRAGLW